MASGQKVIIADYRERKGLLVLFSLKKVFQNDLQLNAKETEVRSLVRRPLGEGDHSTPWRKQLGVTFRSGSQVMGNSWSSILPRANIIAAKKLMS